MYNCSCFNVDHDNENVSANGDTHEKVEPKDVDQNGNEGKSIHTYV